MMTDKEINTVDSLKASFKSGVRLMPEAFSHLIDEAYKAYEIIDGIQGDGPTAGLKRDDKGKLTLNTQHSGGLNSNQGALALSLKPEGGLSFDGGGYLKLDAVRQIQFADFFSLSRGARMEITQVLGLKRTMITHIVSPFPIEDEHFGHSVSLNAAGDCLAVGSTHKVCVYTRRKSGEWNISKPIVFEDTEPGYEYDRASWRVGLDAAGDCLALGEIWREVVHVYTRTKGVWDTKHPIVFPRIAESFGANVSLNAAGDCLVAGGYTSPFRLFMRRNGIWDIKNPILFPAPSDAYEFGVIAHLSASGNRLAVCDRISVIYVYTRTNGIWDTENPIKFSHPEGGSSSFSGAFSLNAEGNHLAAGTDFYKSLDGEVYLYTLTDGIWDRENPIKFSAPASGVYFGGSLELNDAGDRLAVGANSRVYVYTCLNDKWNMETPMEILNPSGNSDNLNGFGGPVGLNKAGTSLVVGAMSESVDSQSKAGAVYVFENVNL
ncbi:hypothetical protein Ppb6_03770 [Photorhabdus australis subsp. thailandensis]|uniref:Uncharacterized protein n=1 Tax=Photorhabdus australis subsp. thailandensis TaxID=2805096 RepID=A0A1C0TZF8_9GAMM|nr:hypothetical protein [Photorhabdus australis]OCQ51058.1 hypothetical protein Ppb6_03770 [Photorhabdus australis subsp. thailandensis]